MTEDPLLLINVVRIVAIYRYLLLLFSPVLDDSSTCFLGTDSRGRRLFVVGLLTTHRLTVIRIKHRHLGRLLNRVLKITYSIQVMQLFIANLIR